MCEARGVVRLAFVAASDAVGLFFIYFPNKVCTASCSFITYRGSF